MKVVINCQFGGFGISIEAAKELGLPINTDKKDGHEYVDYYAETDPLLRTNENLINLIETKGSEYVSGWSATLRVIEVPTPYYRIKEYDGNESIEWYKLPIEEWYGGQLTGDE